MSKYFIILLTFTTQIIAVNPGTGQTIEPERLIEIERVDFWQQPVLKGYKISVKTLDKKVQEKWLNYIGEKQKFTVYGPFTVTIEQDGAKPIEFIFKKALTSNQSFVLFTLWDQHMDRIFKLLNKNDVKKVKFINKTDISEGGFNISIIVKTAQENYYIPLGSMKNFYNRDFEYIDSTLVSYTVMVELGDIKRYFTVSAKQNQDIKRYFTVSAKQNQIIEIIPDKKQTFRLNALEDK